MAIGKWAKKKSAQATKAVGKRYGVSYGRRGVRFSKNSMSKIAKDVMMIKSQLNVEKKHKDTFERSDGAIGQVNVNADGSDNFEITPDILQGVEENERVGNSLKATGMVLKFSMLKQNQAEGDRRVRIYVVRTMDISLSSDDVHNRILDINPFVPVRDYNSNLDYTQIKDSRIKIIATKNVYFSRNGADGLNISNEQGTKSITIPVKLNDVLRYENNNASKPANVKFHVVCVADNGNSGATDSSVLGVYVPQNSSGIAFKCHSRFWYVDN
jgi:hypothetical protein